MDNPTIEQPLLTLWNTRYDYLHITVYWNKLSSNWRWEVWDEVLLENYGYATTLLSAVDDLTDFLSEFLKTKEENENG